jgi:CheY-like chemotaxis protein/anti-sigma regulatory factor (Ser/Thr protein kinase)
MVEPIDRKIHVRADQQRLKQVFVNLLSNAVKYSTRDSEVTVSSAARDDRFRIVLSDAGPGIAPEKLPRLFQPFERLGLETQEGAAEGIGLGLALSKALVEAMGGEIGVESSPGAGTSFWVDLELAFPPDHDVIDVEPEAGLPHGLGVILYIEDNPSNLRLVERVLERRPGIRLVGASSGAEGMRQVADLAPQLVLLDLDLPDMRGEEVLDRLRGEPWGREVPIVVLSADATPGLTRRLSQLGSTAHLTKPVDIQSLLDTVDDLIGEPL